MEYSETKDIIAAIERAQKGDKEAFSYLYKTYYTPIYRYVYFRIGSKKEYLAEDLVQDVFLKAYTAFSRYSYSGKSPLAYFYTIARNILIDRSRKKEIKLVSRDSNDTILQEIPDTAENPDQRILQEETAKELRKKIDLLSPDQQDVIILRFIDGLSTHEIAEMLGKNEAAVRQLQSKGLKSLRTILNDYDAYQ